VDIGIGVVFDAIAQGGVPQYQYAWSWGDGNHSTSFGSDSHVVHTYAAPGSYLVNVTLTDAINRSVSGNLTEEVNPLPVTSEPQASSLSADGGQAVEFTTSAMLGTPPYDSYDWQGLPPGCPTSVWPSVTCSLDPGSPGNFSIRTRVVDLVGGSGPWGPPLEFPVLPAPYISSAGASRDTADIGQPVNFTVIPGGGTGVYESYTWSGMENATCSGSATAHPVCRFTSPGTLAIRVACTDSNGATSAPLGLIPLAISTLPNVTGITADRARLDIGQTVRFNATVQGGYAAYHYNWTGLSAADCIGYNESLVRCLPPAPGPVALRLFVTDANGGRSPVVFAPSPWVYPDPVVSPLRASATHVVRGAIVTVEATVTGGFGSFGYLWNGLPTGCNDSGPNVTCQPGAVGIYSIQLTATDGDGFSAVSDVLALNVTAPPAVGSGNAVPGPVLALAIGLVGGGVLVLAGAALARNRLARRRRRDRRPPQEARGG
jgi:hypothetical protein